MDQLAPLLRSTKTLLRPRFPHVLALLARDTHQEGCLDPTNPFQRHPAGQSPRKQRKELGSTSPSLPLATVPSERNTRPIETPDGLRRKTTPARQPSQGLGRRPRLPAVHNHASGREAAPPIDPTNLHTPHCHHCCQGKIWPSMAPSPLGPTQTHTFPLPDHKGPPPSPHTRQTKAAGIYR